MKNKIGYSAKCVRESQDVTIEELHNEMIKHIPVKISMIQKFENGIFEEEVCGEHNIDFGDFTGLYYKTLLNMNNQAAKEIFDYVDVWKDREETLRTFIMADNQFKRLKRYITNGKRVAKIHDLKVYNQLIDFEEYFQDQIKRDMGVNKYAWA